jgi:hypothetical protein
MEDHFSRAKCTLFCNTYQIQSLFIVKTFEDANLFKIDCFAFSFHLFSFWLLADGSVVYMFEYRYDIIAHPYMQLLEHPPTTKGAATVQGFV